MSEDAYPRFFKMLESEEERLQNNLKQTRKEFEHSGLKGDENEEAVRDFLKKYLPRTYNLGNGEIIDSKGHYSKEVDIAICNQFHPFTYSPNGRGVLFIEGVDGVVEIKSQLTDSHLEAAIDNCQSVRGLEVDAPGGILASGNVERVSQPPYLLFAFESEMTLETIKDRLRTYNEDKGIERKNGIDFVVCLDRGVVLNSQERDQLRLYSDDSWYGYATSDQYPPIYMFLFVLYDKMPNVAYMPNFLMNYMVAGDEDVVDKSD